MPNYTSQNAVPRSTIEMTPEELDGVYPVRVADLASSFSCNVYEPVRQCISIAPPKRFFRSFWRTLACKILVTSVKRL